MKQSLKLLTLIFALVLSLASAVAFASGDHEGGHSHDESEKADHHDNHADSHADSHADDHNMSGGKENMFLKEKHIDGYEVSFHVMDAKDGMKMGDETHHLMIKVEKDGKELKDIKVNSKVVFPNGKAESKMLMKMGGWFMAGYNLNNTGKHQLMILFKTADGKKHSGGVYYTK